MDKSLSYIWDALPALMAGAGVTLRLTVAATLFGSVLGIALSLARLSKVKPLSWLARIYIDFVRGTPLLVQLVIIYFGFPALVKSTGSGQFSVSQWAAAIVGLSLNSAAYLAEILGHGRADLAAGNSRISDFMTPQSYNSDWKVKA